MLTPLNLQQFGEKTSMLSTSEEMQGSLQDQALIAQGKVEDVVISFRKSLIKKAENIYLYKEVEAVMHI